MNCKQIVYNLLPNGYWVYKFDTSILSRSMIFIENYGDYYSF